MLLFIMHQKISWRPTTSLNGFTARKIIGNLEKSTKFDFLTFYWFLVFKALPTNLLHFLNIKKLNHPVSIYSSFHFQQRASETTSG
jgi:hypothetical protein